MWIIDFADGDFVGPFTSDDQIGKCIEDFLGKDTLIRDGRLPWSEARETMSLNEWMSDYNGCFEDIHVYDLKPYH